jgi:hypothetical protein
VSRVVIEDDRVGRGLRPVAGGKDFGGTNHGSA